MLPIQSSTTYQQVPAGMVLLPNTSFRFQVAGTEYEGSCNPEDDPSGVCCKPHTKCGDVGGTECQCGVIGHEYYGVDVQFPWEQKPLRNHDQVLKLGPLLIDRDLVTNDDYLAYLGATGYKPEDSYNWLRHWSDGRPKPGDGRKPVVNLGLEEARDYCRFRGKRLPHSYEWQYAAQGFDGRSYPWGSKWDDAAVPSPAQEPAEIGGHPKGDSPFGVRDLVGNVWQWTDAFEDDHTRAAILRGSSRFRPTVTDQFPSASQYQNWYFPPALELNRHSKYLLMSPSYDRAGMLGFRCAADVAGGMRGPFHYSGAPGGSPLALETLRYV